jgi:hypothetical protein
VLGNNLCGIHGEFRDQLRALGLEFVLQVDPSQRTGWAQPIRREKNRTRWRAVEKSPEPLTLLRLFAAQKTVKWRPCSWEAADGQIRPTGLAWLRVYLAGALDRGARTLEGVWLVVD